MQVQEISATSPGSPKPATWECQPRGLAGPAPDSGLGPRVPLAELESLILAPASPRTLRLTMAPLLLLALILPALQDAPPRLVVDQTLRGSIDDDAPVIETATLATSSTSAPTVGLAFTLQVEEAGRYTLELSSRHFDAYLVLRDGQGAVLAEDDDGLLSTHSQLTTPALERGATYIVQACALQGGRGAFELVLRRGPPAELSPPERAAVEIRDLQRHAAVIEERDGPQSEDLAWTLTLLGRALNEQSRRREGRDAFEGALAIYEAVRGPEDVWTAMSLMDLGRVSEDLGELSAARAFHERALAITEGVLGPDDEMTAACLNNMAGVLKAQGKLSASRPYYERALEAHEQALGPDHPKTAVSLSNLGLLLLDLGELGAARRHLERALAISEAAFGPEHPSTGRLLNTVGGVLLEQGELRAAVPYFERSLAIREQAFGPGHPSVAQTLGNLAGALKDLGELSEARALYERAFAIEEAVSGPEHPATAGHLNTLGMLLATQGELDRARSTLERALAIRERALGPEHPLTASSLTNLGQILTALGEVAAARRCLERALAIRETVLGPEHPDTGASLRVLATWHREQGDLAASRACQERTLAIFERTLGPEHHDTAWSLNELGSLLREQGELRAARPYLERALSANEKALGHGNVFTARNLNNLALLLTDLGERQAARDLVLRSAPGRRAHLLRTLGGLTEAESFHYLAARRGELDLRLHLFASDDPELLAEAYAGVSAWKGQIARTLVTSRGQLAHELDEGQRELVEQLRARQAQLSRALLEEASPEQARRLESLRTERNRLELELGRTLEGSRGVDDISLAELRAALPPGSALLDVLTQPLYTPATWNGDQLASPGSWSEDHVVAWIVRPERPAGEGGTDRGLVRVDLGPAAELEAATRAFLEELVARRGVSLTAPEGPRAAAELRGRLWEPLAGHLEGVELLLVSPDSFLGTLPLETVELADGSFLIEELGIVYLQDVSSLARRGAQRGGDYGSLLAIGGVDFRARDEWARGGAVLPGDASIEAGPSVRGSFTDYWGRLPATEYESQVVVDMHADAFGGEGERTLLQGGEPSEERLKHELARHAVLHLATHGFFQPEGTPSMWESALSERGMRELRMSEEAAALVGKHPGLLSGLVCAGANRQEEEGDDGYLTAEEVGWLDLSRAELVVMSACETGLGRPQSGEGLMGLRRAFRVAGAKTVISSLWSVKDESTAELMQAFYKNLFLKGMGRYEALRAAQLAMLASNRMEHGEPLPSTWGAFVLSGEWR